MRSDLSTLEDFSHALLALDRLPASVSPASIIFSPLYSGGLCEPVTITPECVSNA